MTIYRFSLLLIAILIQGCATAPLSKESPIVKAFNGCEGRGGIFRLDYSDRTGAYKVTCEDMFIIKFGR